MKNRVASMKQIIALLLCLALSACFVCVSEETPPTVVVDGETYEIPKEFLEATEEEWEAWEDIIEYMNVDAWVENYEPVPGPGVWFANWKLPGNVYCIAEMKHEQCVCAFLILGEDKALLLDTGTGVQNIREQVEIITDLPVTVLNSHDHFDHMGGNAPFDEIWCYNDPDAIAHLTNGPTEVELKEILGREKSFYVLMNMMGIVYPETVPGKAPTGTVEDGQVIDLGNRQLEVIHTPGHQKSCIMLLDRENRLLFTGDMFYPGPMYCFFDDSSFPDYVKSIRKAADLAVEAGVEEVYCSHNLPTEKTEVLCRFADFLEGIESGAITDYYVEDGARVYEMNDDISMLLPDEGSEPVSGYSVTAGD